MTIEKVRAAQAKAVAGRDKAIAASDMLEEAKRELASIEREVRQQLPKDQTFEQWLECHDLQAWRR